MDKKGKISMLKVGFLYYASVAIILSVVFLTYIWGTPLAEQLNTSGWLYFVPGALSQAALFALVPFALNRFYK